MYYNIVYITMRWNIKPGMYFAFATNAHWEKLSKGYYLTDLFNIMKLKYDCRKKKHREKKRIWRASIVSHPDRFM